MPGSRHLSLNAISAGSGFVTDLQIHARSAELAKSKLSPVEVINELYLTALARYPQPQEMALMQDAFTEAGANRRQAVEDVLWALVNSKEFLCSP